MYFLGEDDGGFGPVLRRAASRKRDCAEVLEGCWDT